MGIHIIKFSGSSKIIEIISANGYEQLTEEKNIRFLMPKILEMVDDYCIKNTLKVQQFFRRDDYTEIYLVSA